MDDAADEPVVRLAAGPRSEMRLTLSEPQRPWQDDVVDYLVSLNGSGLDAWVPVTSFAGDALDRFLSDTADQFRGWAGVRSWRSLEDQFRIEATWGTRGHVTLRVRLRPTVCEQWDVSAEFDVEAGAELQSLAVAVARFFVAAD